MASRGKSFLFTLVYDTGGIEKVHRGGRGGWLLKSKGKRTGGERSSLCVRSLCQKISLIFQAANRVLSDMLLGSY